MIFNSPALWKKPGDLTNETVTQTGNEKVLITMGTEGNCDFHIQGQIQEEFGG